MNLNDLYRPIGRLYEETPSANYFGDYSAASGDWNNVVEDYEPLIALNKILSDLEIQLADAEERLRSLTRQLTNCVFEGAVSRQNRGFRCINNWFQMDKKRDMEVYRDTIIPAQIANLKTKIKDIKENQIPKANADKLAGSKASKDVVLKDLETIQTRIIEETKQKKAQSEKESKEKQTEAELKAKKIFLSIIASGLVLASAGYAIFKR